MYGRYGYMDGQRYGLPVTRSGGVGGDSTRSASRLIGVGELESVASDLRFPLAPRSVNLPCMRIQCELEKAQLANNPSFQREQHG